MGMVCFLLKIKRTFISCFFNFFLGCLVGFLWIEVMCYFLEGAKKYLTMHVLENYSAFFFLLGGVCALFASICSLPPKD